MTTRVEETKQNQKVLELEDTITALQKLNLQLQENALKKEQMLQVLIEGQKQLQMQNEELLKELKSGKYSGPRVMSEEQRSNRDKYVSAVWNLEGATDKLVCFLEQWMFADADITDKGNLIYLCCLLERGEEETAAVGLRKYYKERGAKFICDYLPLAWLANKIGLGGEVMKKAAFIFSKLEEERKKAVFTKCLKEKTFAIVGNSPDIIGSKLGKVIDSRDIVFRMNTYAVDNKYVEDTGHKINAFVNNSNFVSIDHNNFKKAMSFEWIYIPCDFWHMQLSQFTDVGKFINSYYDILANHDVKVTWLYPEESVELKKRLQIISPTSGMAIFYSIYKRMGYVEEDWFFGFSKEKRENGKWENPLKDPGDEEHRDVQLVNLDIFTENDECTTFYKNAPCYSRGHNLNREIELRNELFEEGKLR